MIKDCYSGLLLLALAAEIVETTFAVSHFLEIQKETTLLLVVPNRNNQKQCSFSVISAQK